MVQVQARRDVWEHGQLPLYTLLPHIDSLSSVWGAHEALLSKATRNRENERKCSNLSDRELRLQL